MEEIERAVKMLRIAAEYIEDYWPDAKYCYDDSVCDGYCIAEDCRSIADAIENIKEVK